MDLHHLIKMKMYQFYEERAAELLQRMGHTLLYQNYRAGQLFVHSGSEIPFLNRYRL